MSAKHKLQQMLDSLQERDKNAIEEMNGFFGGGATIENRIILADGRAMDALCAIATLAKYIMESEQAAIRGEGK